MLILDEWINVTVAIIAAFILGMVYHSSLSHSQPEWFKKIWHFGKAFTLKLKLFLENKLKMIKKKMENNIGYLSFFILIAIVLFVLLSFDLIQLLILAFQ